MLQSYGKNKLKTKKMAKINLAKDICNQLSISGICVYIK